ncbi:MAG: hypothetical protein AB1631_03140 [Acidobacteriota bacterium]
MRIRALAETAGDDDLPAELFDEVASLVDQGHDKPIHSLIDNLELSEKTWTAIDYCLQEAGYRLHVWSSPEGKEPEPVIVIPFAVLFSIPVLDEEMKIFPNSLPRTVREASEKRIIRRSLGLGQKPTVYLDNRIYCTDIPHWRQESITRRYLKSFVEYARGKAAKPTPLAVTSKRSARGGFGELDIGEVNILHRALCGVVIASENGAGKLEGKLFNEMKADHVAELGRLIRAEIASLGLQNEIDVSVFPHLAELWQVPEIGLQLQRHLHLNIETEVAMQRLLDMVEPGEVIAPVLYASHHGGEELIREIRLAAYSSEEAKDPFFTYVWQIAHELEQPEDVSEGVMEIGRLLSARLVMIDGLFPNQRCSDCGGVLFPGPGGMSHGFEE